jgi:hypothetical protein
MATALPSAPALHLATVWTIGNARRPEFRSVVESLGEAALRVPILDEALIRLRSGQESPEQIVLLASVPGEFSERSIQRLRQAAPLASLTLIEGPWCEGVTRSRPPVPGLVALPWWQVARVGLDESTSGATLADTASPEERCLAGLRMPWPKLSGHAAIATINPMSQSWLASLCESLGLSVSLSLVDQPPSSRRPTIGICELHALDDRGRERLRRFAVAVRPAPVLVLLDFPRPEDLAIARGFGVSFVLGQPVEFPVLVETVGGMVGRV